MSDRETAVARISALTSQAVRLLAEAERTADEHNINFTFQHRDILDIYHPKNSWRSGSYERNDGWDSSSC